MSLPSGWIPNYTAPENEQPEYTGTTYDTWTGPGPGLQPRTANNPEGTVEAIKVMSMHADAWDLLSGPQGA